MATTLAASPLIAVAMRSYAGLATSCFGCRRRWWSDGSRTPSPWCGRRSPADRTALGLAAFHAGVVCRPTAKGKEVPLL